MAQRDKERDKVLELHRMQGVGRSERTLLGPQKRSPELALRVSPRSRNLFRENKLVERTIK